MSKQSVLFVCVHNSARSQMAEAFVNELYAESFHAESAGLEPGKLNPIVVKAMAEIDIDISNNKPQGVAELIAEGREYTWVITVCDPKVAEQCPVFPGEAHRLTWSFDDPSGLAGSDEERLERTRVIREQIKSEIQSWQQSLGQPKVQNA